MNDWFEWNGVKCSVYGMKAVVLPTILTAGLRISQVEIPGKSGSLTISEGDNVFSSISLSATCIVDDPDGKRTGSNISRAWEIASWLRGSGEVKFANRPEGYYKAVIANQISFDKILRGNPHVNFAVNFNCDPYFYLDTGKNTLTKTTNGSASTYTVSNAGTVESQPLIKITRLSGSSDTSNLPHIQLAGQTLMLTSWKDMSYIYIDTEMMVAYTGNPSDPHNVSDPLVLRGTRIEGDWIKIPKGQSTFNLSGSISKIEIIPRWRCA